MSVSLCSPSKGSKLVTVTVRIRLAIVILRILRLVLVTINRNSAPLADYWGFQPTQRAESGKGGSAEFSAPLGTGLGFGGLGFAFFWGGGVYGSKFRV